MIQYYNTILAALALWLVWFLILAPWPHRHWEDKVLFVIVSALFFTQLHLLGYTLKDVALGLMLGAANVFFLWATCLAITHSPRPWVNTSIVVGTWAVTIYFFVI